MVSVVPVDYSAVLQRFCLPQSEVIHTRFGPLMPVAAHSESGLSFDVFAEDAAWIECDYYSLKASKVVWTRNNQVKYYDLKEERMILEMEMDRPREIEISDNGSNVGVLNGKGEMIVFGRNGISLRMQNVSKFRISDLLVAYVSSSSFYIHQIDGDRIEEHPFHNSRVSMLEFSISGEFVFLATKKLEKDGMHRVLRIGKNTVEVLHSLKELQGFSLKTHVSNKCTLLLLMTSYVNNSYFAESELYLYDTEKRSFKGLGYSPVHSYTFLSSGFAVCHGPQPSSVSVHGLDGKLRYNFPEGTRNRIFFNQHENIAVFAGFDNLSGDIEVFHVPSRKLMARFNVLGASLVDWKESGSYFYVSTTSYFQEDNKITLYDYYGRKVDERQFKSLFSACGYGEEERFVELEKPEKLTIEKQEKYVPPSIHTFVPKAVSRSSGPRKKEPVEQKPRRSRDDLLNVLREIEALKDRMRSGEELSVKELNLILKEPRLKSELKGLVE